MHQANKIGGKVVVIAGEGEPTIHKDFRPIIKKANALGMITIFYTNGSMLTEEIIKFCKENNAVIIISLDSLDKEKYDSLTGTKDQLKKVLENIKIIKRLYKDTIKTQGDLTVLRFAINTTLSKRNETEIASIRAFCGEDIYFICNPLAKLGKAANTWRIMMGDAENTDEFKGLIKNLSESGGPLMLGRNETCNYSSNGIAVSPEGYYMTCAYTNFTNGLLGDIKTKSLKEAYEYKHKVEAEHLAKFGKYDCLIRSPSFLEYVKSLKK